MLELLSEPELSVLLPLSLLWAAELPLALSVVSGTVAAEVDECRNSSA